MPLQDANGAEVVRLAMLLIAPAACLARVVLLL